MILLAIVLTITLCDQFASHVCKPIFTRFRPTHHPDFMDMGIRPEDVVLSDRDDGNSMPISVKYIENYGNNLGAYFDIGDEECMACIERGLGAGRQLYWGLKLPKLSFFDVDSERNVGYPEEYTAMDGWELDNAGQLLNKRGA